MMEINEAQTSGVESLKLQQQLNTLISSDCKKSTSEIKTSFNNNSKNHEEDIKTDKAKETVSTSKLMIDNCNTEKKIESDIQNLDNDSFLSAIDNFLDNNTTKLKTQFDEIILLDDDDEVDNKTDKIKENISTPKSIIDNSTTEKKTVFSPELFKSRNVNKKDSACDDDNVEVIVLDESSTDSDDEIIFYKVFNISNDSKNQLNQGKDSLDENYNMEKNIIEGESDKFSNKKLELEELARDGEDDENKELNEELIGEEEKNEVIEKNMSKEETSNNKNSEIVVSNEIICDQVESSNKLVDNSEETIKKISEPNVEFKMKTSQNNENSIIYIDDNFEKILDKLILNYNEQSLENLSKSLLTDTATEDQTIITEIDNSSTHNTAESKSENLFEKIDTTDTKNSKVDVDAAKTQRVLESPISCSTEKSIEKISGDNENVLTSSNIDNINLVEKQTEDKSTDSLESSVNRENNKKLNCLNEKSNTVEEEILVEPQHKKAKLSDNTFPNEQNDIEKLSTEETAKILSEDDDDIVLIDEENLTLKKTVPQKSIILPKNADIKLDFLKHFKRTINSMTKKDLEEFVMQKIEESIIHESEFAELHDLIEYQVQIIKQHRKKIIELTKYLKDLEMIHCRVYKDLQTREQEFIIPAKIVRSVGLQIGKPFKPSLSILSSENKARDITNQNSQIPKLYSKHGNFNQKFSILQPDTSQNSPLNRSNINSLVGTSSSAGLSTNLSQKVNVSNVCSCS